MPKKRNIFDILKWLKEHGFIRPVVIEECRPLKWECALVILEEKDV